MSEIHIQVTQPKSRYSVQELENCLNRLVPVSGSQVDTVYLAKIFNAIDAFAVDYLFLPTKLDQLQNYLVK